MQSKLPKKSVIAVMLALSFFLMSISLHGLYLDTKEDNSVTVSKHYTNSFQTSIIASNDDDIVVNYGAKRVIRRVVLSKPEDSGLHNSSAEDVLFVEAKTGIKTTCIFEEPAEDLVYSAELIDVVMPESIGPGEEFEVEITLLNTGNMPWFSASSGCPENPMNLGTAAEQDRESLFGDLDYAISGWLGSNRVEMATEVVHPEEIGTFKFSSKTPWGDTWYKEYFMPVIEDHGWLEDTLIGVDILVDKAAEQVDAGIMQVVDFSTSSTHLDGEKRVEIDLSEQEMNLFVGDTKIKTFYVSTGAWDTPTPTGTFYVLNKQELRIGGAWPHYRMPNWMGFTVWGHGIHSLPYLANDGGAFWYEALDHIGTPVSHGCIRTLPDDSELLYDFGEVDMKVVIYK
ncbi:MAG: L,D-transpeptidase [Patescibacteria group bacterium]|nr:L,D-transpeptidase [Patescibacteria group bacterium]